MLTCIACSKQIGGSLEDYSEDDDLAGGPSTRQAIKALTSQIKDMAVKATGAYRHCRPCAGDGRHTSYAESEAASESERWNGSCRRTVLGREVEERLRAISGADVTPSMSGRMEDLAMEMEEYREWVAQVEPGVLITLFSLPYGKNDLRRIRFSREMFNRRQAQRWWAENCDKVMELYNVHRLHRRGLPTPPRSEDESSLAESAEDSPVTPPLFEGRLPRNLHKFSGAGGGAGSYSSPDSLDHHPTYRRANGSGRLAGTPKLPELSAAAAEASSVGHSARTSGSAEDDQEREWVEQDEPGVYITIRALAGGGRALRRVRFSRDRFGEMHAKLWWEENRARVHQQYL
ncbi:unnamed protein product [Spirodela intermedia]|uniref:BRX domain-containing protein n=2 Tax=Spirodela intermedia TaxID=51605 RepID=A0A7I8KEY6_SPIIN|nr:unnamed protein product [Spirodela intermedia]CAA6659341.1 unnamed protein product [Spirodela intermedia]CAA7395648.1 unnamed protein product [Spirodela intermedia]